MLVLDYIGIIQYCIIITWSKYARVESTREKLGVFERSTATSNIGVDFELLVFAGQLA
jgi:hypothetical protein